MCCSSATSLPRCTRTQRHPGTKEPLRSGTQVRMDLPGGATAAGRTLHGGTIRARCRPRRRRRWMRPSPLQSRRLGPGASFRLARRFRPLIVTPTSRAARVDRKGRGRRARESFLERPRALRILHRVPRPLLRRRIRITSSERRSAIPRTAAASSVGTRATTSGRAQSGPRHDPERERGLDT